MSPERTQLLREQFPALASQELRFECGDGWYALLKHIFAELAGHVKAHKLPIVVVSVREQYGSLRVETSEEGWPAEHRKSPVRTSGLLGLAHPDVVPELADKLMRLATE